jgi:hypothetical protein
MMHAPMAQAIIMAAAVRRNGFLSGVILDPRNPVQTGFDPQWPDLIFSGGHEMKDNGSGDACRNGKDSAPSPIRENAKGKYQQASQYSDFDQDRSHCLIALSCQIQGPVHTAWLLRLPRMRSARSARGPKINAVQRQALVDLPRSSAM